MKQIHLTTVRGPTEAKMFAPKQVNLDSDKASMLTHVTITTVHLCSAGHSHKDAK